MADGGKLPSSPPPGVSYSPSCFYPGPSLRDDPRAPNCAHPHGSTFPPRPPRLRGCSEVPRGWGPRVDPAQTWGPAPAPRHPPPAGPHSLAGQGFSTLICRGFLCPPIRWTRPFSAKSAASSPGARGAAVNSKAREWPCTSQQHVGAPGPTAALIPWPARPCVPAAVLSTSWHDAPQTSERTRVGLRQMSEPELRVTPRSSRSHPAWLAAVRRDPGGS